MAKAPEGNERYRILIENTHDIVYSLDIEGNLTYISPQVGRYGFKPGELMSQNFLDFVHAKDQEEMLYGFRKTITEGSEFISQFRIKNKRGRIYWIEEYGKVERDKSGEVVGINGVLRDVTERKRIEEKLRKAHKGLERKVQERTAELRKTNEALIAEISERKGAERALQESYRELHRSLEGTIQ